MIEVIARFLIGGIVVSAFAALGDVLKPKSFAGLFGAAPSVALATLGLTIAHEGKYYAHVECPSMLAGAIALCLYSIVTCWLLRKRRLSALHASLSAILVWFAVAFGLWFMFLRPGIRI
jgi:hypothetical protein